eukprot:361491-Chlamydomonas_euryale.AAC.4
MHSKLENMQRTLRKTRVAGIRYRRAWQSVRRAGGLRPGRHLCRQLPKRAAHLCAVLWVRPHGRPAQVCRPEAHAGGDCVPRPGAGSGRGGVDCQGRAGGLLGGAAELPPGKELPAEARGEWGAA